MRIGYLLDTHGAPYDQPVPARDDAAAKIDALVEEGILAERAGFHSLQVPERHGRTETYFPTPFQLMAILGRETERVAIGTFATVLTLYHPMQVAEQAAVIDNLTRGRHYLTLARGYHSGYWDFFGVPEEKLLGRFLEGIQVIRRAFEGERFSFNGEHFQVRDALLTPQPYQERFPIWGGGQKPAAIRRSAEYGECWTADDFPIERETWEAQVAPYRREAEALGKRPFVVLMRNAWVADTFEQASRDFGEHYCNEMRFYFRHGILTHDPEIDSEAKITPDRMRAHIVVGSRDDCIEQLERYREELGVDYVTLRFRMPTGPSFAATREQIQRFGEEVVSYFHGRYPAPDHPGDSRSVSLVAVGDLAPVRALAPGAFEQLLRAEALSRAAVDPMLLEPARHRIAELLGAENDAEPAAAPLHAAAEASLPLTEQFVVYVPGVTPELRAPLGAQLGEAELHTFVEALYVVDAIYRLRLVHARLFPAGWGEGAAAEPGPEPPPTDDPARDLSAALEDLHAQAMLLSELDPATTELVRLRCARYHDCKT